MSSAKFIFYLTRRPSPSLLPSSRVQHPCNNQSKDANHNAADHADERPGHGHQLASRERRGHSLYHRRFLRMSRDVAVEENQMRSSDPNAVDDAEQKSVQKRTRRRLP